MPRYDLTEDKEAAHVNHADLTATGLLCERVISKVFSLCDIPLSITDNVRATFREKLRRMGRKISRLGGTGRKEQLNKWKKSTWPFTVNTFEYTRQMKRKLEQELNQQVAKRRKCEEEIKELKSIVKEQSRQPIKPLSDCTRQQQHNRQKGMVGNIRRTLVQYEKEGLKPQLLEFEQVDTGKSITLDITKGTFCKVASLQHETPFTSQRSALYIKDKFTISNEAYHELTMVSDLPSSHQIKKLTKTLNSKFNIRSCPNGVPVFNKV